MKKLFAGSFAMVMVLGFSLQAGAQMYFEGVATGIFEEDPLSELHVRDAPGGSEHVELILESAGANNDSTITFRENTADAMSIHYDGAVNDLILYDLTTTPDAKRVTFERSGNVGIGTNNPTALLEVAGTQRHQTIRASESPGGPDVGRVEIGYDGTNDFGRIYAWDGAVNAPADLVLGGANVAIGQEIPSTKLHVQATGNDVVQNICFMYNDDNANYADVLSLKINQTTPGAGNNYITFYNGNTLPIGAIEGNGTGGIVLRSGSADFAEFLPRLHIGERIEPGDIVGVIGGKVSKATRGAEQVKAVSSRPIVLGNAPAEEKTPLFEKIAFLGRVPVKVRGPVRAGDYILPAGLDDGSGVAVPPDELTITQSLQVVGRAWENSAENGVKLVDVAVGLDGGSHHFHALQRQKDQMITDLVEANRVLLARIEALEKSVGKIQASVNGSGR